MERCQTMMVQGKEIHLFNYEGLRGDELLATLQHATQIMLNVRSNKILVLANFTNTYI